MQRSTKQRWADDLLGVPVEVWLRQQLNRGLSYRQAAAALRDQTAGRVVVSHTTVQDWLRAAASAAERASA